MIKKEEYTDEQLMTFLQKGNASAFTELYKRYGKRILYFMFKMLPNDEAKAQDLTQDIFMKVIEKAASFDPSKNFKTWIFTLAANHCKNYFRSNSSHRMDDVHELLHYSEDKEENMYDHPEFLNQLKNELNYLKSPYKETVILRYTENLKLKEIAEIMECPVGTVKSRLNYGLAVLHERLSPVKKSLI